MEQEGVYAGQEMNLAGAEKGSEQGVGRGQERDMAGGR
jgi:hypothetical protein